MLQEHPLELSPVRPPARQGSLGTESPDSTDSTGGSDSSGGSGRAAGRRAAGLLVAAAGIVVHLTLVAVGLVAIVVALALWSAMLLVLRLPPVRRPAGPVPRVAPAPHRRPSVLAPAGS